MNVSVSIQGSSHSGNRYGDYQKYPEEPEVGTEVYPASIYNSWDPNWRGFIGTTFIVMLEQFPDLISDAVQDLILASLFNATVGDSYRVGGVDDDNLYPSYSNPVGFPSSNHPWTRIRGKVILQLLIPRG